MSAMTPLVRAGRRRCLAALGLCAYVSAGVALTVGLALHTALSFDPIVPRTALLIAALACAFERRALRVQRPLGTNGAAALGVAAVVLLPPMWAVASALGGVVAASLTRKNVPTAWRLFHTAHTFSRIALVCVIDRVILQGPFTLQGLTRATTFDGSGSLVDHASAFGGTVEPLLALVALYCIVDAVPWLLAQAVAGRGALMPGKRCDLCAAMPGEMGMVSLGLVGALAVHGATALVPLILLGLAGLESALYRDAVRRHDDEQTRDRPADRAALHGETAVTRSHLLECQSQVDALLDAVRALGRHADLNGITVTLARSAVRMTPFRSCVVYLYDARGGIFVPSASDSRRALRLEPVHDVMPRAMVESLMSDRNRVGYSYLARRGTSETVAGSAWHAGDIFLAPLLLQSGDVIGFLSLDAPADDRMPGPDALAPLETVAGLAASVIARLRHTDEVLHLAATDALTGLLNRRAFEVTLQEGLDDARQQRRPLALLMIDLDDFGSINNTYGHQVGDEALRLVSRVVRAHLRERDAGGRYGGDEFAVILPGLDSPRAAAVAERFRTALMTATAEAASTRRLPHVHTSIGVASFPDAALDMDALIKSADDALYESKRHGKNCVSLSAVA